MGTHPIFESDFDCLTECCEKGHVTDRNRVPLVDPLGIWNEVGVYYQVDTSCLDPTDYFIDDHCVFMSLRIHRYLFTAHRFTLLKPNDLFSILTNINTL